MSVQKLPMASHAKQRREVLSESRMREICLSGSMSGERKRSVAEWPKLPRLSSTLPLATKPFSSARNGHHTLVPTSGEIESSLGPESVRLSDLACRRGADATHKIDQVQR